jgi:hypothetical protein
VYFNAAASGGQAPYEYQYSLWDGSVWTIVRGWQTASTFIWNPTVANANYRIVVKARSAWNTGASEVYSAVSTPIMPPVASAALTADVASPRLEGDTVTLTATASGGQGPYQYRFLAGATVLRNWSTSNVFAWTPVNGGFYQLKVQVRSAWNAEGFEREAVLPNYQIRSPTVLTLTSTAPSPQPIGRTIHWDASVGGGWPPWQFQWVLFDGTTWINLTPWTTSNQPTSTFDWTPTVPGASYRVGVRVRSDGNTGLAEATVILPYVIQ